QTAIANGYWNVKPECRFPEVAEPQGGVRPWMVDAGGIPRRPYGEVFYQTAGAFYFTSVCQKCHGSRANGQSGLAKFLAELTGGQVRVANLIDGLFGEGGQHLSTFDVIEDGEPRNLAGNYVLWMASGGTRVSFPPEFQTLVGPNGGNMLNLVRQEFKR